MSVTADVERKRAEARELFEQQALNYTETASRVGVSRETVRRWANTKTDPWARPDTTTNADGERRPLPSTEQIEQARLRAEKARQEARTRWQVRRSEEADAAGIHAGIVRGNIMEHIRDGKIAEARLLAHIYATFINSAQMLSGEQGARRQGDEDGPSVHGPRPTDPAEMAKAGAARALQLVRPTVDVASREA